MDYTYGVIAAEQLLQDCQPKAGAGLDLDQFPPKGKFARFTLKVDGKNWP